MVTRIATFANQQALISRMLEVQKRVFDGQTQVGTEKKSQDYIGIASDSFRVINIENEKNRIERFVNLNSSAEATLKAMSQAITSMDDEMREFRSALVEFTGRDLRDKSPQDFAAVKDIQERAFAVLNDMEFFLNLKIDGKYVFGGGKSNVPPVQLPYDNVSEFQKDYNGIGVTYPKTRAAHLVDATFSNVAVSAYAQVSYGTPAIDITQVDTAANTWQTALINDSAFGDLTFANPGSGTKGTITSNIVGAFSNVEIGQTFLMAGTGSGSNNGVYTVTGVSGDGSTLTLDQPILAPGTEAAGTGIEIRLVPSNGSTIRLSGSSTSNNDTYTVVWPTNAELAAAPFNGAGFNLGAGEVVTGNTLFIRGQVPSTVPETVNFQTGTYYRGDRLEIQHRVSETRSIRFGVNGLDPAFEKAIRGLGQILQGDLMNNQARGVDALAFINEAIEHSPLSSEQPGDLQDVLNRLGINEKVIADTKDDQRQFMAFLDIRQMELENVDPTEAAVKLNDDVRSLNISFATLSRIQQLSLVNFL